jgi:transcriptional regulator with XRE-family HTH domain
MQHHPLDIHIGKRLREQRVASGLSQTQLGQYIGVAFQQVQKYETGFNRIGAARLYECAQCMGASVEYFFEGYTGILNSGCVMEESQETYLHNHIDSKEVLELVRAYKRIANPNLRKKIQTLICEIAEKNSDTEHDSDSDEK